MVNPYQAQHSSVSDIIFFERKYILRYLSQVFNVEKNGFCNMCDISFLFCFVCYLHFKNPNKHFSTGRITINLP